jgi:Domain of unknown function (DUF4282)/zinc-ribbon domain
MQAKGFFAALFDYSFGSFVTPRIIKILYVLATILISLWTLLLILAAFNVSGGAGVVMLLVGGPLLFLIAMIYARVFLELVIVFFRINGNVQEIRDGHGGGAKQPAPIPETPLVDAPVIAPAESPLEAGPEPEVTPTTVEPSPEMALAASAPAPEPAAPPPEPTRFCENCGAERSPGARFCTNCGHA